MKGFGVFVDIAWSTGNQNETWLVLCKSTGVQSLKKKSAVRPNFFINGEQWNVQKSILPILWFCTGKITCATHVS
jgi:hypothetical protein